MMSISTGGAQKEMVIPSVLAIVIPIAVGLVLSVPGVMGMLAGGLTAGFAVAVFMANAGGAWDNAKKFIEADHNPELGGKGSDNHKATVVGDTVGDPFKDTSGPSLNILIKLVSVVSVVFAAVVVKYSPAIGAALGLGFQTTESPHTNAIAAFHEHTATGKLNALMHSTTPSGCHCSIIR